MIEVDFEILDMIRVYLEINKLLLISFIYGLLSSIQEIVSF